MQTSALIRVTGLTALLASIGVAAPANAVTTVGNTLAATPTAGLSLCDGDTGCTLVPVAPNPATQAPGGLVTAAPGVIVRWRVKSGSTEPVPVALRVVRGNTSVGQSAPQSLSGGGRIFTFNTRLSVAAGDKIGLDVGANGVNPPIAVAAATNGARWDRWDPPLRNNETRAPTDPHEPFELLLNADIEADADGDGFGDEASQ